MHFPTLTHRQHNTLMFIAEFFWQHGYQPLTSEIAAHMGISSRGAHNLVTQLESRGYVNRVGRKLYLLYVPNFKYARQFANRLEQIA